MNSQKGLGLVVAVIVASFIMVILLVVLIKPNSKGLELERVDSDKTIIEQSKDMVNQARDTKELIEQNSDISEYLQ